MVQERRIGGRPTEGLANLFGKRYALGSEVRDGKRLDVGLIKDMTGGEVINARHLYEREFKYRPTCTLWLYGNKKPAIHDTSLAVWRRVKLLPFTQTIADKDRDRNLEAKMERDELPGILAWAVLGVLEWQARGLIDPEAVTVATQSYREAEDVLGEWIAECCYLDDPLASILKADLQRNYASWCQDNIHAEVKRSTFKSSLEERGVTSFRGTGNKHYWKGIRLLNDDDIKAREEAAAVAKAQKVTKVTTSPAAQPELPNTADEGGVTEVTGVTDSPPKSLHEKNIESLDGIKVRKVTKVTGSTATVSFTCGNCKGRRYWLRGGTAKLCAACHPPPIEDTPISGSL